MNLSSAKTHGKKVLSVTLIGLAITGGAFAFLTVSLIAAAYGYELAFQDKIFPGVRVAGLRLDGKTRAEAEFIIQQLVDRALPTNFVFQVNGKQILLPRTNVSLNDPDLTRDFINYDLGPAIDQAMLSGREADGFRNAFKRVQLFLQPQNIPVTTTVAKPVIQELLRSEVIELLPTMRDAELIVSVSTTSTNGFDAVIKPEQAGVYADLDSAIDVLEKQAYRLSFQPIQIKTTSVIPKIGQRDIEPLLSQIPKFLQRAPFTVTQDRLKTVVTSSTIAEWLTVSSTDSGAVLAIHPEQVEKSLTAFASEILQEPQDGKLVLDEQGKLQEFIAPIEGVRIDGVITSERILDAWANSSSSAEIAFQKITPNIEGEDAERLGIRELIGVGKSSFSGSPTNRRKNIALGAKKMNGVLIPPDGIFSQLGALGKIDGTNGWLQELVIKGNKTTPEYGGGLCQVGSTSFRMALASGLPIVERRNHSYRVRYYEPAGTDATIYEPAPDFRFKNDTSHHILITTEIKGDTLTFYAWGTKDGRISEQTSPKIYNIVPPPPLKLIPTTELPIGEKKCTESAHAGATASFDYRVTYPNGEIKKETFTSYYRPWGAVCLIGATAEDVNSSNSQVDETGINNPN